LPANWHEEGDFARELTRKEIGSWFSLASPIKTTAGFSIKRRIKTISLSSHPAILPANWDEEEELPTNLHEFTRKEN